MEFGEDVGARFANVAVASDPLRFSVPLPFLSLVMRVMAWTAVLMLGYFTTPTVAGFYRAVWPLVRVVPIVRIRVVYIYRPLAPRSYAGETIDALRRVGLVLTE